MFFCIFSFLTLKIILSPIFMIIFFTSILKYNNIQINNKIRCRFLCPSNPLKNKIIDNYPDSKACRDKFWIEPATNFLIAERQQIAQSLYYQAMSANCYQKYDKVYWHAVPANWWQKSDRVYCITWQ